MLKHRLITAAILIPLVIGGIFLLPTKDLAIALGVVAAIGAWEWTALVGIKLKSHRVAFLLVALSLMLNAYSLQSYPPLLMTVFAVSFFWWWWGVVRIAHYHGEEGIEHKSILVNAVNGLILLVPTWLALIYLHGKDADGPYWLIMLMVLVWGADSGAYFTGRRFGKTKLAPFVSPGKTLEGVAGGVLTSLILAAIGGYLLGIEHPAKLAVFLGFCLLTVCYSVLGDLMESLYKRRVGVKDSGKILPGHGGVLDRIDSMTAAAPLFALSVWLMEVLL